MEGLGEEEEGLKENEEETEFWVRDTVHKMERKGKEIRKAVGVDGVEW